MGTHKHTRYREMERHFSEKSLTDAANSLITRSEDRAVILARAIGEDCCLMHAAYLVALDNPPTTRCTICGERNGLRHGFTAETWSQMTADHALCHARQRRGLPTPAIPWQPSPCCCRHCDPPEPRPAVTLPESYSAV